LSADRDCAHIPLSRCHYSPRLPGVTGVEIRKRKIAILFNQFVTRGLADAVFSQHWIAVETLCLKAEWSQWFVQPSFHIGDPAAVPDPKRTVSFPETGRST